jgi:hypothetical protein
MSDRRRAAKRARAAGLLLAGVATALAMTVQAAPAHAAGLTAGRHCEDFKTGDGLRLLSVCARGYTTSSGLASSVVEMHSYKSSGGRWVDSTSKSITLNSALDTSEYYGADVAGSVCYRNGPVGSVGCSTPNTARVAYYGAYVPRGTPNTTTVYSVSWRDDRNLAHYVNSSSHPSPGVIPFSFSW